MTKISHTAVTVVLLLAFCVTNGLAQSAESRAEQAEPLATLSAQDAAADEPETNLFENWGQTATPVRTDTPSTIGLFIRMVLVLAVVVVAIYGIVFLLKKTMRPGAEDDPFLRKVSQVTLSPGKTVQVVTLFNHAYLVGVTDGSVNLLGEITDKDLVDAMNLYADQNANVTKPRTFADILRIFMPNEPREQTGAQE